MPSPRRRARRASGLLLAALVVSACSETARAPAAEGSRSFETDDLVVGSLTLSACATAPGYYCGTLTRPLDPAGAVAGSVDIHFEWLPHGDTSASSLGTLVGISGGPGYGSTSGRAAFARMYGPLTADRDMLLVDARGTGESGAIRCGLLQSASVVTLDDVAACGKSLGDTADLYGTGLAADDMAAVLDALGVGAIDLYGDSYGTYSAQVFVARHPSRVRTVVLDASYPVLADDPFYGAEGPGMRSAFDLACSRALTCAAATGSTHARLVRALRVLRADPASAPLVARGSTPASPMTPADIGFVMNSAGLDPIPLVELDAALRAISEGDPTPLVRLVAEAYAHEEGASSARPEGYSMGLFAAASCNDNPQVYDMTLPPHARKSAYEAAVVHKAATHPDLYGPFTIEEFLGGPLDYVIVPLCQTWPVASASHPAGQPVPPGTKMPDVPALVLTGDLDTITPVGEGDKSAAEFLRAQRVIVPNGLHVTALYDGYGCVSGIVQGFVSGAAPVDATCAATTLPPIRLLSSFAPTLSRMPPAVMSAGRPADLRAAAAATTAASDVLRRYWSLSERSGACLRGGTFSVNDSRTITFTGCRWVSDLTVDGALSLDPRKGDVSAALTLGDGANGSVTATWNMNGPQGLATITGTVGSHAIAATMPAP